MTTEQTRTFRARLDEASRVAAFVESAARELHPTVRMRLRLAAEELFLNTVTHGHGGDADAPVDITVALAGDRAVLTYVDSAPAFDPFAGIEPPDGAAAVEARAVGHLGLVLVTRLAERCEYRRVGDRNRVVIELSTTAPG